MEAILNDEDASCLVEYSYFLNKADCLVNDPAGA